MPQKYTSVELGWRVQRCGELGKPGLAEQVSLEQGLEVGEGTAVQDLFGRPGQGTGSRKQQRPAGPCRHTPAWASGGRSQETGRADSARAGTLLPPLAGQTAEASGDPPPWVIICFWPGIVCPQGLSVYRAGSQKWGQGGEVRWSGHGPAGTAAQTSPRSGRKGSVLWMAELETKGIRRSRLDTQS